MLVGKETFGKKLKELRVKKGLSREQLFTSSGVNARAIRTYEDEQRAPSAANLFKLSESLGVDCSYFKGCEFDYNMQSPTVKKPKPKGK